MKWRVEFRYIADYDMMTPLMHIPLEATIIDAPTAEVAWKKLLVRGVTGAVQEEWYRKERIECMGTPKEKT